MRTLAAIPVLLLLALALPVHAQSMDPQPPPVAPEAAPDQTLPDQGLTDQNFTSVAIVAIEDLPLEIRSEVEAVIAQTSPEELHDLQRSISASPQAASALAANGLDSSQVVAANIGGDGTLTLIIQTTT
jgi:hypothetical protein